MRWENLFEELGAQLEEQERADLLAQVPDLVRAERSAVRLADRLRAATGTTARLGVRGGGVWTAEVVEAAPEWVLLAPDAVRHVLVPTSAVTTVEGLGPAVAPAPTRVAARLGLASVLRALARDRVRVRILRTDQEPTSAAVAVIDAVYADHIEVRQLLADRWESVPRTARAALVLPFAAVAAVEEVA